jgi:hypothetical protein
MPINYIKLEKIFGVILLVSLLREGKWGKYCLITLVRIDAPDNLI